MTNTLYIYCQEPLPRIRYVFEHIRIQLKLDELVFLDKKTISEYSGQILINYSADYLPQSSLQFIPGSITETTNRSVPDQVDWIAELPYFFKTNKSAQDFQSYDVPGMIFYMLSRMEEYESQNHDSLGRMEGENSFGV